MPKSLIVTVVIALTSISTIGADWPMQSGSPQRTGWAKSEHLLTKTNVASLDLLYKYRADNLARGLDSLTSPIISGDLITYRGFKEMLIFSGSSDKMFSLDADLDKLLWQTNFPDRVNDKPERTSTSACPGGLTAPVLMAGSSSGSIHFAARASRTPCHARRKRQAALSLFPAALSKCFPAQAHNFDRVGCALYRQQ